MYNRTANASPEEGAAAASIPPALQQLQPQQHMHHMHSTADKRGDDGDVTTHLLQLLLPA
jgi:hypothetical protein